MSTLLFPLDADTATVLIDALNSLPDDYHDAAAAETLRRELREYRELAPGWIAAKDTLRRLGLGTYRERPQG